MKHAFFKTNQQMRIKFTLLKARVPMHAVQVHIKSKAAHPGNSCTKGKAKVSNLSFIRESDNLPDTGTLRSTCYELYWENANQ